MNDSNDNDDDFEETVEKKDAINLDYVIFQDEEDKSVYIKFEGFQTIEQLDEFEEFIENYIPLIFAQETVIH